MARLNIPRWATVTWFAGAMLIVSALGFNAYRLRLDVEQTVGYFFGNFGSIFTVLVLFGVLLYGAVALASGRKQLHRSTLPASIRKRYIAMTVISAAVYIPMAWLVFVRPLGDLASIGVAVALAAVGSLVLTHIGKPLRNPEVERLIAELPDAHLKANDEPNEPARWVP